MARILIDEPLQVQREFRSKALEQIEDREFPALIVRIDSPWHSRNSQEIYSAIKRLKEKGCKVRYLETYREEST